MNRDNNKSSRVTMEEINNKNMTDEERMALAAKLDADLDNFIAGLEKKRYTDGWTPETFEKVSHVYVHAGFCFHSSIARF